MLEKQKKSLLESLQQRGVSNPTVLKAFDAVPRELFVSKEQERQAYEDRALPIQAGQTISQPYIVGLMTQALMASPKYDSVLEIGTGSGYQTAILAHIFQTVYSIERIECLHKIAKERLEHLNLKNVQLKHGDGFEGWQEYAPYDGIIVTAAPDMLPYPVVNQLNKDRGILILPIGAQKRQVLKKITRDKDRYVEKIIEEVRFVPMVKGTSQ